MAIHVAEEARHISFAHEYLRKRVPAPAAAQAVLAVAVRPDHHAGAVPAIVVPPRAFWKEFDIPRSVTQGGVLPLAGVPADAARHVRRRPDAVPRHRADEPGRQADVADLQDRRQAAAGTAASRSASTWCRPPRSHMPHVITQSCCSDGSCVYACPVNCIHPSPDEPGFATAEMLYIDPVACVDCGACVSACPVGAIAPDTRLEHASSCRSSSSTRRSIRNGRRGEKLPPTSKLAPVIPAPEVRQRRPATDGGDRRLRARPRCMPPTNC